MIIQPPADSPPAGTGSSIASTRLFDLLVEHQARPFTVIRPTGNAGDVLIWVGAEKLMRLAGIRFEVVSVADVDTGRIPPENVVYIHGGGVFVPFWSNTPTIAMAEVAKTHRGHLIFGPSSCIDDPAYLRLRLHDALKDSVCESVTLFWRDKTSLAIAAHHTPDHVQQLLDHDTALNLSRSDLWEGDLPGRYRLFAIRRDAESSAQPVKSPFAFCIDPVPDSMGFEHWMRLHANASELVTNRLHSSICGSILGIPTTLLPNSYHKNSALWEFSLKSRGVVWSDHVPNEPFDSVFELTEPVLGLMRTPTARRIVKFLHGASHARLFRDSNGPPRGVYPE